MQMPVFTVKGKVDMGRRTQTFTHELEAETEQHARQLLYTKYGSEHAADKTSITITSLEEE
jgi:ribosomal protein L20A (L18A)